MFSDNRQNAWSSIQKLAQLIVSKEFRSATKQQDLKSYAPFEAPACCLIAKAYCELDDEKGFLEYARKYSEFSSQLTSADRDYCLFYLALLANRYGYKKAANRAGVRLGPARLHKKEVSKGLKEMLVISDPAPLSSLGHNNEAFYTKTMNVTFSSIARPGT